MDGVQANEMERMRGMGGTAYQHSMRARTHAPHVQTTARPRAAGVGWGVAETSRADGLPLCGTLYAPSDTREK